MKTKSRNFKKIYKYIFAALAIVMWGGCKDSFLEPKPTTNIVIPTTLNEMEALLNNVDAINKSTPALSQLACDDYEFVDYAKYQSSTATERNSYIWAKDIFEGATGVPDWANGYKTIFYCNNVLAALPKIEVTNLNRKQYNLVKGWALFVRAYALYDLARNFCDIYNGTPGNKLGLPIRLSPNIDEIAPRSTLQQTYGQIFSDLNSATSLLDPTMAVNRNKASKPTVHALLARIYLSMGDYPKAELYVDSLLTVHSALVDYNPVSNTAVDPFPINVDETIFTTAMITGSYTVSIPNAGSFAYSTINSSLMNQYDIVNDRRFLVYNRLAATTGKYYGRRGYLPLGWYYTGLATDEMYLIKAECLARRNQVGPAMTWVNNLLTKRFVTGTFVPLTATNQTDALNKILLERRKELLWRSLRWSDLKRLNAEGANITLTRVVNGVTYTLPPNDPRYVFPIPDEEIALSGIQQNIR